MRLRTLLSLLLVLAAWPASAQVVPSQPGTGAITAQDAGSCATAGACVTFQMPFNATAMTLQISGTFSATLSFDTTTDGTNWVAAPKFTKLSDGSAVNSTTAVGQFAVSNTGLRAIRVRAGTWASGTATVVGLQGLTGPAVGTSTGGTSDATAANQVLLQTTADAINAKIPATPSTSVVEGNPFSSGVGATIVGVVRRDTLSPGAECANGDQCTLNVQADGAIPVVIVDNTAHAFATLYPDATVGATGNTTGPLVFGECDDTSTVAVTEGKDGPVRINCTTREIKMEISQPLPVGTVTIGNVGLISNTTSTGAAAGCYIQSAASTNSSFCKASAGNFYGLRAVNTTATIAYLRLYNLTSGPTCSSATGFVETIPIPASTAGAGVVALSPIPLNYSTGIAYCITGGGTSTDNTSSVAGVYLALFYK